MRLTLALFGLELDITLGPASDDEPEVAGSVTSYPVGFAPSQLPEWEVAGSYHQFDDE